MSVPQSWWTWILRANQLVRMTVADAELQWAEWYPDSTFTTVPSDAPDDYYVCRAITSVASFDPCATGPDDTPLTVTAQAKRCSFPRGGGADQIEITPDEECTCTRWYFTLATSDLEAVAPDSDAGWESMSAGEVIRELNTTPQDTAPGANGPQTGGPLNDALVWRAAIEMDAGLAALIASGGATVRGQARCNSRFGIGISEAAQDLIGQMSIRVTEGEAATIRGTALAFHNLASSAGSAKWPAQATKVNRVFPPAAASNVLSAVAGTTAGDYLLIEMGYRNFTVAGEASGGEFDLHDSTSAGDLPEDETTTSVLNSWVEICG